MPPPIFLAGVIIFFFNFSLRIFPASLPIFAAGVNLPILLTKFFIDCLVLSDILLLSSAPPPLVGVFLKRLSCCFNFPILSLSISLILGRPPLGPLIGPPVFLPRILLANSAGDKNSAPFAPFFFAFFIAIIPKNAFCTLPGLTCSS